MNKLERITKKIEADKELMKMINNDVHYITVDRFIDDAKDYIKAIKEGRMICVIDTVSKSGMSRTMMFHSCNYNKYNKKYCYQHYYVLFKLLGYTYRGEYKRNFTVHGCGMDMIFHTNYNTIHKLHRLGFISKKQCDHLAQQTPVCL